MPLVNVMINGRAYTVACDDGEEEHLKLLGEDVDSKVRELLGSVGQVGETRLLLMASLLLADELNAATTKLDAAKQELLAERSASSNTGARLEASEAKAADVLEHAVKRLETLTAKLSAA
jgi:cell division protein ZapA